MAFFMRESSQCSILISLISEVEVTVAEHVAGPEVGQVLALPLDLGVTGLDRVEVVREASLADDLLARGPLLEGREGRDLGERFVGHLGKQGDSLQLADVHGRAT